jgi:nucleotidyltransferase substrate binding protein (TIGR01987 family)
MSAATQRSNVLSSVSNWLGRRFKSGPGTKVQSPKSCLILAFKAGWILDEREWLAMLADHNQTSHTYDEDLTKAVYGRLHRYLPLLEALADKLAP